MDFAAELGELGALESLITRRGGAGFRYDHYVAHALIKCHAARADVPALKAAYAGMGSRQLSPNARTFSVVVLGLLRCGEGGAAEAMLTQALAEGEGVHETVIMGFLQHYAAQREAGKLGQLFDAQRPHATRKLWGAYMAALAMLGELPGVERAFEEARTLGHRPTPVMYQALVRAAATAGELKTAVRWLQVMRDRGMTPAVRAFNWVLYACVRHGDTASLAAVVKAMDADGVRPNAVTDRIKDRILALLASRIRNVSDDFLRRLSQGLAQGNSSPSSDSK
jgi:pentatricopeptide repeat protein